MNNDFLPMYEEKDSEAFDIWDIKAPEPEPVPEIDEEAELAKERERLREEAIKRGYEEGWQRAEKEINQQQKELAAWLQFFHHPIALLDESLNKEVVQTIFWVCEACIGVELSLKPEKLTALVELIKQELPALRGDKQIAMHPSDVENIINNLHEPPDSSFLKILIPDASLAKGDFYIKGEYGELDGRLRTRLKKLFKSYLQRKEKAEASEVKDSQ